MFGKCFQLFGQMLAVEAVRALADLVAQTVFRVQQPVSAADDLHLFEHIVKPARAVLAVLPAALNQQRARRDKTGDVPHVEILP